MSPRLEIRGQEIFGAKATCQVAPDGLAFEIFVTDGTGDSYMLVMTAEEIYQWAQLRYGPSTS
jgi:hypothetical protein